MPSFDPAAYGDCCAPFYDQLYPAIEAGLLSTLSDFAEAGPALDLGIGTGRVALRLACGGVAVHGVEASAAMVRALRSKPGGAAIPVVQGDFASVALGSRFKLIYCLTSSFLLLPTLELQQACFANIARHLTEDGVFVSEIFVAGDAFPEPALSAVPVVTSAGLAFYRTEILCPPTHLLDAMALEAGLGLQQRWSSWHREPFRAGGKRHISVYSRLGISPPRPSQPHR